MYDWSSARLHRATRQRQRRHSVHRLGETLSTYVQKRVLPRQRRLGGMGAAWAELLPAELLDHTDFADFRRGKLTVRVNSAPHLYELKLLLAEGLLDALRERCPQAGLQDIKLQLGEERQTDNRPRQTTEKDDI